MKFVIFVLVGLVMGGVAANLMKTRGVGFVGNLIAGVIGAVGGGLLVELLVLDPVVRWTGHLMSAALGGFVVLFVIGFLVRTTHPSP